MTIKVEGVPSEKLADNRLSTAASKNNEPNIRYCFFFIIIDCECFASDYCTMYRIKKYIFIFGDLVSASHRITS